MPYTQAQIDARGRMALLMDEIRTLSRERDNLLRPLRDRLVNALPSDRPRPDIASALDCQAAGEELAAVARAEERLAALVADYNALAQNIGQRELKRGG
jgi:hypothetical protein